MNIWRKVFSWLGGLIVGASATSFSPVDFKCPVCGKPSVDSVLMSDNNFGRPPARDPIFAPSGDGIRICPHDLYASWAFRWDELKAGDKDGLAEVLKDPGVVLTDGEKRIIGMRWDELRESPWWPLLWARTCDQARKPDPNHTRFQALQFYYVGDTTSSVPWIQELATYYRDQAIDGLKDSGKPRHRFIRAELMRMAGRTEEAAGIFRKFVNDLAKPGEDEAEERKWLRTLCEEGLLLIEVDGNSSERIAGWLIQPISLPESEATVPEGWARHRIAMQTLVSRAADGEKQAGEILWTAISRDPERVIALDETLEMIPGAPDAIALRNCGKPWTTWFDELAAGARAGKLPDALRKHRNPQRCLNVLSRLGPPSADYMDESWQINTLLPAVIQAEKNDRLPETGISQDDLTYALARLAENEIKGKDAVLKSIVRVLKEQSQPKEAPDYGLQLALVNLAKQSAKANPPMIALDGVWKSDWWKLAAQYAAGTPGVGPALANDPLVSESFGSDGKAFENLTYQLFAARRDPVWKTKIINVLRAAPWLPDEPIEYAQSLRDKEVDAAVDERVNRLRNTEVSDGEKMMSLYEIKHVEERVRNEKMAALLVR
jgi:hypothetical protein